MTVAVASSSPLAAAAGARVADAGGNAVDVALAAAMVSIVTEPGICSIGSGAFVTVWPADGDAVTIDGNIEMPGRGLPPERLGGGVTEITMAYGGGVTTTVGHGSVGTPGALAAFELASQRYGRVPWREIVEPSYEHARDGFPMSPAAFYYFQYSHEAIYGWHEPSYLALHPSGELVALGERILVADLADSLRLLADEGVRAFYEGDIADLIATDMEANGGILTREDLRAYRAEVRRPLTVCSGRWELATNPPPAVGGATLAAMLRLLGDHPKGAWTEEYVARLIDAQRRVLSYRRSDLDGAPDIEAAAQRLLDLADAQAPAAATAPSTVHTSAVDDDGSVCSITASAGYGSGVIPPGTGIWMNNSLGAPEINPLGLHGWPPGTRLPSNMAPTVGRRDDGAALAVGSPGADRITTAILQVVTNITNAGMTLEAAIEHPRLHVNVATDPPEVVVEPGVPLPAGLDLPLRAFNAPNMYFGGAAAAQYDPSDRSVTAAADARRAGAVATGGHA